MSGQELKWGPPPPSKGPRGSGNLWIAEALKAHPREWARVQTNMSMASGTAMKASLARFGGRFEVTTRRTPGSEPRRLDVYARYLGEPST